MWGIIAAEVKGPRVKVRFVDPSTVETLTAAILSSASFVKVGFVDPSTVEDGLDGVYHRLYTINTGVPHVVGFVEDLDSMDVVGMGGAIRHHERFAPEGTNVNFVRLLDPGTLAVRDLRAGGGGGNPGLRDGLCRRGPGGGGDR